MNVEMILAVDKQGGIGKSGRLPWPHCKEDMKRFMETTKDTICVMGRLTYDDILAAAKERGRTDEDIAEHGLLKGRTSFVLSSSDREFPGAVGIKRLRDLFNTYADTDSRIVVIGGEKLFIEALTWVNTIHLTIFDQLYQCDRFFPTDALRPELFTMAGEKITPEGFDCNAYLATYHRRNPVVIRL